MQSSTNYVEVGTLEQCATTAQKLFVFAVFLVRSFPHLDRIRRDTEYLSVCSPNAGKCGPKHSKYGHFSRSVHHAFPGIQCMAFQIYLSFLFVIVILIFVVIFIIILFNKIKSNLKKKREKERKCRTTVLHQKTLAMVYILVQLQAYLELNQNKAPSLRLLWNIRRSYDWLFLLFFQKQSSRGVLQKNVFLKISQNSSLGRSKTSLKKRLWHRCFPVNFAKFLRTPFFAEHLRCCFCFFMRRKIYQKD